MKNITRTDVNGAQKAPGARRLGPGVARSRAIQKLEKYKALTDGYLYELSKIDLGREVADIEQLVQLLGFDPKKPGALRGKKFLDVACGSHRNYPDENLRYLLEHDFRQVFDEKLTPKYLPWLSRYLSAVAGAEAIGIDLEWQHKKEPFKSFAINLLAGSPLAFLESGTFDGIVCMRFAELDNPFMYGKAPGFFTNVYSGSPEAPLLVSKCNELLAEFHSLLKVGGRLVNEFNVFEKQAGADRLIRIE